MKFALLPCLLLPVAGTAHAEESLPVLLKGIAPAVVTIATYDSTGLEAGTGTGFLVARDHVVTAFHVVVGARRAEAKAADGNTYPVVGVAGEDRAHDLILLRVETAAGITPLEAVPYCPEVGERVIVVGSPLGFEQTVSDGIVSSLRVDSVGDTIIQVTAPFSPGSSGSPVVNLGGKVIGVASRQMLQGQNLNFAVPAKWVLALRPESLRTLAEWAPTSGTEERSAAADTTLDRLGNEGLALLNAGRYEEALSVFSKLAQRYPENPDILVNIGSCQARMGHWEEAVFVNERAIEMEPRAANAHFNLGTAQAMLGRWDEALEAFRKAAELDPDDAVALGGVAWAQKNLGRPLEAVETCRAAIELDPGTPEPYRHLADAYLALGRYDEAIAEAKRALEINPEYADAHHTLGLAYSHLGRHQDAILAYQETLLRTPRYAEAHSNLGLAYAELERWPEALEEYKTAVRLKPDLVEVHFNLGVAYFKTGDKASALDEYKILQKLNREDLAGRLFEIIYE